MVRVREYRSRGGERQTDDREWMSQESGTESGQQKPAGRPTQRAAQKRTTTQRAAQSGQQEAAEGPTQETHRQYEYHPHCAWTYEHVQVQIESCRPLATPRWCITHSAPSPRPLKNALWLIFSNKTQKKRVQFSRRMAQFVTFEYYFRIFRIVIVFARVKSK